MPGFLNMEKAAMPRAGRRPAGAVAGRGAAAATGLAQLRAMAEASPATRRLQALQRLADGRMAPVQCRSDPPLQRQVPPQGSGPAKEKEVANTVYQARGGKNVPFDKNRHRRSKFRFGAKTKDAVFSRFNPVYAGNRIISVEDSNRRQVNVEGLQLDHQISWDRISAAMHKRNRNLGARWTPDRGYSLWDAKMYYNDIDNLVPALGGINAAAGARGVDLAEAIHPGLSIFQGRLQGAWMNLQAGLSAVGTGISDDVAAHIATRLGNIATEMNNTTEALF